MKKTLVQDAVNPYLHDTSKTPNPEFRVPNLSLSIIHLKATKKSATMSMSLFKNKRFMLNLMPQRNASKFAIFLEYEN